MKRENRMSKLHRRSRLSEEHAKPNSHATLRQRRNRSGENSQTRESPSCHSRLCDNRRTFWYPGRNARIRGRSSSGVVSRAITLARIKGIPYQNVSVRMRAFRGHDSSSWGRSVTTFWWLEEFAARYPRQYLSYIQGNSLLFRHSTHIRWPHGLPRGRGRRSRQCDRLVEVLALYLAVRDPRVPWYAKVLAACVVFHSGAGVSR
jgi:hypothetical protein